MSAAPADDGRTTDLSIWHRMYAQRPSLSRSPAPATRKVRSKAARRFGPDRGIDFERDELNVWV
eukprot:1078610-Prymnesium_polylepis.1